MPHPDYCCDNCGLYHFHWCIQEGGRTCTRECTDIQRSTFPIKQCQTIFKESGHRCEGIKDHTTVCQDFDYPDYSCSREIL